MRKSDFLSWIAIVLLPAAAAAQPPVADPAPAATPAATTAPASWTGSIDFGVRGTGVTGDAARYERYRDLGDGLFLEDARASREFAHWILDVGAEHVGRRDQR